MSEKLTTLSDLDFVNAEKLTQGMLGYIERLFWDFASDELYRELSHLEKERIYKVYFPRKFHHNSLNSVRHPNDL